MKKLLQQISQAMLLIPVMVLGITLVPSTVSAAECSTDELSISCGADCAAGNGQATSLFGSEGIFRKVTNVLLFLIGAVAVIMLIIGGIRYVISGGDQAQVTGAKNTILYAIVGIVVAFLAYAAVSFVTTSLATT